MTDAADKAMIAIAEALHRPFWSRWLLRLGLRPPRRIPIEDRKALRVLRLHMLGHPVETEQLETALNTVILRVQPSLKPGLWDVLLDDYEAASALDDYEAQQALSLIMRGEVEDCLHHLERALPGDYAAIGERLAHHFRSRK